MIAVSHPTGNRHVRSTLTAFDRHACLHSFWTGFAWRSEFNTFLPSAIAAQLQRRSFENVPFRAIRQNSVRELSRLAIPRLWGLRSLLRDSDVTKVHTIYSGHDRFVSKGLRHDANLGALYAYWGGARRSFARAQRLGVMSLLEIPTLYWKQAAAILAAEAERQPEWAATLRQYAVEQSILDGYDEELGLADIVVVPGNVVLRSLPAGTAGDKRILVVPYGCPAPMISPPGFANRTGPIKALFVGSLTQAKGLSYLFRAANELKGVVELTVVGRKTAAESPVLDRALANLHWKPDIPHAEVIALMRDADILVHPSLLEGMALVVGEAMAQGLPAITTANSGWDSLIEDGVNGYIVAAGDWEAIAERLLYISENRHVLEELSRNAWLAALTHTDRDHGEMLFYGLQREIMAGKGSAPSVAKEQHDA